MTILPFNKQLNLKFSTPFSLTMSLLPFSWKDRPALIESLFPVQKISAESYKEQSAVQGKTLTALGSYWKGRKPLILNKACVLGCLLPATGHPMRDLEVFELLMGMDHRSLAKRLEAKNDQNSRSFLSASGSLDLDQDASYRDWVNSAWRAEECDSTDLFSHIWTRVNDHLGTDAHNFAELVKQMGVARFGHRPRVADVFSGSGQIPFEAAHLGCDVHASDLNPIACMLTWGAFNIVGAPAGKRAKLESVQQQVVKEVQSMIDGLGVESDGRGWTIKSLLYCIEVVCPETGWRVPLLPTLLISLKRKIVLKLRPDAASKSYHIDIIENASQSELTNSSNATVKDGTMVHSPDGKTIYRSKISALRGDRQENGSRVNNLRMWEKSDFHPKPDDVFQERLYCIQWMKPMPRGKKFANEFRAVTEADLERDQKVLNYVAKHFSEWQEKGYLPDMLIESGTKTDEPIRTRGWTHWHHLHCPRQLLFLAAVKETIKKSPEFEEELILSFSRMLDWSTKLCRYGTGAARESISQTFYNQALNTFYNYGVRSFAFAKGYLLDRLSAEPLNSDTVCQCSPANTVTTYNDIYITDPPYGDAVKYEEITEFFIAWLRKNPPKEFASWTWDSRRALAIKGEDDAFRQGMIAAYRNMAQHMPDNGIQVLMFTHQSGSIWADMANIIWASGLQVTAAWYVVTETDSALRDGSYVKGTIMLVLRKRLGEAPSFRDDLGWEIEEAVKQQIEVLTGLDQQVRDKGAEGLYSDADLQMAGYAAALKVLTSYSHIDGKDMVVESEAPKVAGRKSFVEDLIDFAVQTAVQFLVPLGFEKSEWQKLAAIERFYLKMVEMEAMGEKSLDNYQNFAKAFKVKNFDAVMSDSSKANHSRLKLSTELKSSQMSGEGELRGTPLRALLYALFELSKGLETDDVLNHLGQTHATYLRDKKLLAKMADYLADKRAVLKPAKIFTPDQEASHARILAEAIRNQKL